MIKIKLELDKLTDEEFTPHLRLIAGKLTGNATFPTPPTAPADFVTQAAAIEGLLVLRRGLLQQAQQLTLEIRTAREQAEAGLTADAGYVEGVINKPVPPATSVDPAVAAAQAQSAGMAVQDAPTPVGAMPRIDGLVATQGDADGEIDLAWNAVKRGLKSYVGELTDDPAGQTGWRHAFVVTRSSASVPELPSGKRHWFRVAALGTAGQDPWSDPATKVAP